ncbi:MAG: competence protein TfoX [Eisenbergiella sp.]
MASSLEFVGIGGADGCGQRLLIKRCLANTEYCNGKIVGLICENQLFIKITEAGRRLCPDYEKCLLSRLKPYLLVEDIDDRELLANF